MIHRFRKDYRFSLGVGVQCAKTISYYAKCFEVDGLQHFPRYAAFAGLSNFMGWFLHVCSSSNASKVWWGPTEHLSVVHFFTSLEKIYSVVPWKHLEHSFPRIGGSWFVDCSPIHLLLIHITHIQNQVLMIGNDDTQPYHQVCWFCTLRREKNRRGLAAVQGRQEKRAQVLITLSDVASVLHATTPSKSGFILRSKSVRSPSWSAS